MIVAINTPMEMDSARLTDAGPRSISRTRHTNSEVNRPVTSHAKRSEGAVSLPSSAWVNARIGIRSSAGSGPKYM